MINSVSLIVDNVRSSENVGSFFRTCDALGIDKIFLVGYTPKPLDKFNRPDSKIAKTALGAEKTIFNKSYVTIGPLVKQLKKEGYTILGLELSPDSIDYRDVLNKVKKNANLALIVGNEVDGISSKTLKYCDYVVQIPMRGNKESLNVSVATGIALSELTRLW
jgi:tRNA G18 (ribose-2'-O)-methylase SpoU